MSIDDTYVNDGHHHGEWPAETSPAKKREETTLARNIPLVGSQPDVTTHAGLGV